MAREIMREMNAEIRRIVNQGRGRRGKYSAESMAKSSLHSVWECAGCFLNKDCRVSVVFMALRATPALWVAARGKGSLHFGMIF